MAYTPGPFDVHHLYLQWGGKLPGNEQWSCGIRLTPVAPGGPVAVTSGMLDSAVMAIGLFHGSAGSKISPNAKLSFVKLNPIGVDGRYIFDDTTEAVVADVGGTGSGGATYPNQVALVVSLTTGFSRGPAHRGRFYLPLPTAPVDVNGMISASDAAGVGVKVDELLTNINAISAGMEASVMSRKDGAPGHRRITGCEVGRILDTQRRRRRSLIEDYQ